MTLLLRLLTTNICHIFFIPCLCYVVSFFLSKQNALETFLHHTQTNHLFFFLLLTASITRSSRLPIHIRTQHAREMVVIPAINHNSIHQICILQRDDADKVLCVCIPVEKQIFGSLALIYFSQHFFLFLLLLSQSSRICLYTIYKIRENAYIIYFHTMHADHCTMYIEKQIQTSLLPFPSSTNIIIAYVRLRYTTTHKHKHTHNLMRLHFSLPQILAPFFPLHVQAQENRESHDNLH